MLGLRLTGHTFASTTLWTMKDFSHKPELTAMYDFASQGDRDKCPAGIQSAGCLEPRHRQILLIISLLVLFPVSLAVSCSKEEKAPEPEPVIVQADSSRLSLAMDAQGHRLEKLDIFVYTHDSGKLEMHGTYSASDSCDAISFSCSKGCKDIFIVANSPYRFNTGKLMSISSMRLIAYEFSDDSESVPIMGCELSIDCSNDIAAGASLKPLLSYVELSEIVNGMEDYELLESVRIRLKRINASACLFQKGIYSASEYVEYGEWKELEHDIGLYPQYPGIRLPAYPNEMEEDSFRADGTVLELQCHIMGERCSFELALPSLPRDSTLKAKICIESPDEHSGSFE